MRPLSLVSCGKALPARMVDNHEFASYLETSDSWIRERTGIVSRYRAEAESTYSLGLRAAENCLAELPRSEREKVAVLIFSTLTPQRPVPFLASSLQADLGLSEALLSFDINAACSAYVYALELARHLLQSRAAGSTALIVASEVLSELLDYEDRSSCILFGDGAAASLWTLGPRRNEEAVFFRARTMSRKDVLCCDEGGKINMDGKAIYRFAVTELPLLIRETLEMAELSVEDVDLFLLHQANQRILEAIGAKLGIPPGRLPSNIASYGNTSAVSLGLLLCELWEQGELEREQTLCLAGFGAGLSLGALILKGHQAYVAQ